MRGAGEPGRVSRAFGGALVLGAEDDACLDVLGLAKPARAAVVRGLVTEALAIGEVRGVQFFLGPCRYDGATRFQQQAVTFA